MIQLLKFIALKLRTRGKAVVEEISAYKQGTYEFDRPKALDCDIVQASDDRCRGTKVVQVQCSLHRSVSITRRFCASNEAKEASTLAKRM